MTIRQELIERLKHNRTVWKWLSDEEKHILESNKNVAMMLAPNTHDFGATWICVPLESRFRASNVYRLSNFYTEESERPNIPSKMTGNSDGEHSVNKLIDCINWLYAKVERMEK